MAERMSVGVEVPAGTSTRHWPMLVRMRMIMVAFGSFGRCVRSGFSTYYLELSM
jgi:hypothetical protein